jgi:eukaryotic-like serine/threonine-protein kinase
MKRTLFLISLIIVMVVLALNNFFVESYSFIKSEGDSSDWKMSGRDLVHSSGDGESFEKTEYINKIVMNLGSEALTAPVVSIGFAYIAGDEGKVYQFNAANLTDIVASFSTGGSIDSSPIVVGDYVYVGSSDGKLYKLNVQNVNDLISSFDTEDSIAASPIISDGFVYIGTSSGTIYQLSVSNMEEVVSSNTIDASISSLAAAGDYIYAGASDGVIYQFNAKNLSELIAVYATGGEIYSAPAVYEGKVYIGSSDGFVYQLDALNISNLLSSFDTGYAIRSSPAIHNNFVYIGSLGGTMYQLSTINVSDVISSFDANGAIYSSPVIYQNNVYFETYTGTVYKLDASDLSNVVDKYELEDNMKSSMAVTNNYVYFGTDSGSFYQLATTDFSLENIDVFPPAIAFIPPTDTQMTTERSDIIVAASAIDEGAVQNITIYLYDSLNNVIANFTSYQVPVQATFYGLANGLYYFNIYACDLVGNCGSSETRSITISAEEQTDSNTWQMFRKQPSRVATDGSTFDRVPGLNQQYYFVGSAFQSSPCVVNDFVYVGSNDGNVYQLNAADISQEVSSFTTGAEVYSSPAVVDSYVYVGSDDGFVYQLDSADISNKISSYETMGSVRSSPAVAGGYVYVGSDDGFVYQLDALDISNKISEFNTGGSVLSSPAIAGGYVYVGSNSNELYQLNASNINQLIAEFNTAGWVTSSPVVANGYVYVGSQDGYLYQFDASNIGVLIASYNVGSNIDSSPAVVDGFVYVGSNDGYVYQFDAADITKLIAKYNSGGDVSSTPAIDNGCVYVGSAEGKVHQLNASNVSLLIANYTTGAQVQSSPAIAGGYVYVGSNDGKLYQLNKTNLLFENYDAVPPNIDFVAPSERTDTILARSEILVNVSAEDDFSGLSNITVYIYNSSKDLLNYVISESDFAGANFSYLEDGQYYFNATACDFNKNCNSTETRTVFIDNTAPLVQMDYNLIGINLSNSEIYVNVSVYDLTLLNVSVYLYDLNGNLVDLEALNESNEEGFNFSNISDGKYTVIIEACDALGNCNSTQMNNITVDTINPNLEFYVTTGTNNVTYDENGTLITESPNVFVNLSANDSNLENASVSLFDANDNLLDTRFAPSSLAYFNFSNLPDGEYYLQASACDYSGNCRIVTVKVIINTSSLRPVTIIPVSNRAPTSANTGSSAGAGSAGAIKPTQELCDAWSACISGEQTRTCRVAGIENRTCEAIGIQLIDSSDVEVNQSGSIVKKSKSLLARLFDINLGLVNKNVQKSKNLTMIVSLINLGIPGQVNATLYYEIDNASNAMIYNETEIIPVETQEEFIKSLDINKLASGSYKLLIDLKYEGQKEPAQAQTEFVVYDNKTVGIFLLEHLYLIILIILLAGAIVLGFYIKKRMKNKELAQNNESVQNKGVAQNKETEKSNTEKNKDKNKEIASNNEDNESNNGRLDIESSNDSKDLPLVKEAVKTKKPQKKKKQRKNI